MAIFLLLDIYISILSTNRRGSELVSRRILSSDLPGKGLKNSKIDTLVLFLRSIFDFVSCSLASTRRPILLHVLLLALLPCYSKCRFMSIFCSLFLLFLFVLIYFLRITLFPLLVFPVVTEFSRKIDTSLSVGFARPDQAEVLFSFIGDQSYAVKL